jgi:Ser/Thr protein kinase RdoA (MazF antagonist)
MGILKTNYLGRVVPVRPPFAADLVAHRYGLGRPVGPPAYAARGELGRIWRLDTDRGCWAVKEALVPVDEAAAEADVVFQQAAAAAGVPLPAPVRAGDGRVVLPGVEAGASAYGLRVYAWADLDPDAVVTAAQLGAVAARLHAVEHPVAGPVVDWFAVPLGRVGWEALADRLDSALLRSWLPELVALDAVVTPPEPDRVRVCHRDLNDENVRRGAAGGVVVLDWENSGPCQPERELALLLADLPLAGAVEAYAAYRAAGGPAEIAAAADFSTAIAVQGHLLDLYGRRATDPAASEQDRARGRWRLSTMLARPLTLASIMDLLTALDRSES